MSKQQTRQQLFEEFEYKQKAGSAWSHNYLNQKPWHPMSYPNQRRKWIAEQMHGMTEKRKTDVEREFEKEQDFFKSSALLSKKQRQKVQSMQSVSFMYTKPPGYNAESARAAELEDEKRKQQQQLEGGDAPRGDELVPVEKGEDDVSEALILAKSGPMGGQSTAGDAAKKKKAVPRDVFGNKIATEEDFEILKNAPRVETGIVGRAKPFGVELRNVRCGRCGEVGHQSGDRECPMKDTVSEADAKRQQREDPLSLILVANRHQGLTWEPKQALGGFSPPRGGFTADDPNQQILPPEDEEAEEGGLVDPYGGFLLGADEVDPGLAGVSHMVLESLTKQQRKDLKRALRTKEKEEKRRRRKERKAKRRGKRSSKGTETESSSESAQEDRKEERSKKKRTRRKDKMRCGESSTDTEDDVKRYKSTSNGDISKEKRKQQKRRDNESSDSEDRKAEPAKRMKEVSEPARNRQRESQGQTKTSREVEETTRERERGGGRRDLNTDRGKDSEGGRERQRLRE